MAGIDYGCIVFALDHGHEVKVLDAQWVEEQTGLDFGRRSVCLNDMPLTNDYFENKKIKKSFYEFSFALISEPEKKKMREQSQCFYIGSVVTIELGLLYFVGGYNVDLAFERYTSSKHALKYLSLFTGTPHAKFLKAVERYTLAIGKDNLR